MPTSTAYQHHLATASQLNTKLLIQIQIPNMLKHKKAQSKKQLAIIRSTTALIYFFTSLWLYKLSATKDITHDLYLFTAILFLIITTSTLVPLAISFFKVASAVKITKATNIINLIAIFFATLNISITSNNKGDISFLAGFFFANMSIQFLLIYNEKHLACRQQTNKIDQV